MAPSLPNNDPEYVPTLLVPFDEAKDVAVFALLVGCVLGCLVGGGSVGLWCWLWH